MMQKYLTDRAHIALAYDCFPLADNQRHVYLASDVDARIAELERQLAEKDIAVADAYDKGQQSIIDAHRPYS